MDTIDDEKRLDEIQIGEVDEVKSEKELQYEKKLKWNFGLEVYYSHRKNVGSKEQ